MNATSVEEDALRADLAHLTQSSPPSVTVIEQRAHQLHRRHRTRVLAVVAASGAVLTLAAAGTVHVIGWEPGPKGEVPMCTEEAQVGEAFLQSPADLPDALRLGWTAEGAPEAGYANGRKELTACAYAAPYRMLDLRGGRVVRTIELTAQPLSEGGQRPNSRLYDLDRMGIESLGRNSDVLRAGWLEDGIYYDVWAEGVTRGDLKPVLKNLTIDGLTISVDSVPAAREYEVHTQIELADDGTVFTWYVASDSPDGKPVPVTLSVTQGAGNPTPWAEVGDVVIDLEGKMAIQEPNGTIRWSPSDGMSATVFGSLPPAELMRIALSVEPRPAADFADLPPNNG